MPTDVSQVAHALRRVTDEGLRDLAGSGGFSRGRAYCRQHRVGALRVLDAHRLTATVRGSGNHRYRTDVELSVGGAVVSGDCSCPLGGDCKHVVALVMTARETLGLAGAASGGRDSAGAVRPVAPVWERLLGDILTEPVAAPAFTPVALLVADRTPSTGRFAAPGQLPSRLGLRPLVRGQTGWVKTGLTWNTLAHPGRGVRLDPRHRQALEHIARTVTGPYGYYHQSEWIDLESLGGSWLSALRLCRRVGVDLVSDQRNGVDVLLGDQPARISLDLSRTADGDVAVTPSVVLPDSFEDVPEDAVSGWIPVGTPMVGLWRRSEDALRLVEFDPPLDAATGRVLQSGQIIVPAVDVPRFLTGTVPPLAKRLDVASGDDSVPITVVEPPRLVLSLTHRPPLRLGLSWSFRYALGDSGFTVPPSGDQHADLRDGAAEVELLNQLAGALPEPGTFAGLVHLGPTGRRRPDPHAELAGFDVVRFLRDVLPGIEALPGIEVDVHGEVVDYAEATDAPSIRLSLTDSGGPGGPTDWFDLDVEVSVAEEHVPIADLVRAFTVGEDHLLLATGTWFRLDRPELTELRRLVEEARALQDDQRGPLRLSAYHADLWSELEALGVVAEQSERWSTLVKGLTEPGAEAVDAPQGLEATLRPYQHDGFSWMTFLRRNGLGGILADDMGLGKTVQTLAMILQDRQDAAADGSRETPAAPWLVVAPTSVLSTWAAEAERFAPSLRVAVLRETSARRHTSVAEAVAGSDVVVTSYSVFRLDADYFGEVAWAGLVLDEAQAVKNHQAVTYARVRTLPVPVRFAITGTPMENNLMELWALLSIVAPGLFPKPTAFAEHYRRPIESGSAPERLDTLRRRIRPVMMRRTKQLVAADLPPKQEQLVPVELSGRHRRHYDRTLARQRQRVLGLLEDPNRNRIAILRALTVLRQASLHPALVDSDYADPTCAKLETLMERLEPVVAEGHQVLVFSQFTRFLAMARARMTDAGISYSYLDGRTRKRQEAIETFRSGQNQVFLISLKAGGVGLTLTEADYVFVLDPWWNPAVEAQAVDRTHRIGQDKRVNVYRLVSAETIEDKVVALQERKRELFANVVDEGALASGALSTDDIRALL